MDAIDVAADRARLARLLAARRATADALGLEGALPGWCFAANPVATALMAAAGVDLARFRPADGLRTPRAFAVGRSNAEGEMTARLVGVRVGVGKRGVLIDADAQTSRIVLGGDWPETALHGLAGRMIGEIVDMGGDAAGATRVRSIRRIDGGAVATLECRLEPMAPPPDGVDAWWLREWLADPS